MTDANLVLGRLVADRFLGGTAAALDEARALDAVRNLATQLGLEPEEAALGVLRVANATMERALRRVSLERGHDPRDYVLVPFGGAGPLHACDLADSLGIRNLLVPRHPGVLSALGLLMADVSDDASMALISPLAQLVTSPGRAAETVRRLEARVLGALGTGDARLEAFIDLRYQGQSYELETPVRLPVLPEHLEAAGTLFHELHRRRYGYAASSQPVEATAIRLRGSLPGTRPEIKEEPRAQTPCTAQGMRDVWFEGVGRTSVPLYRRKDLEYGHEFTGPALVVQYDSTLVVPPGWRARIDAWHNAHLDRDDTTG